MEETNKRKAGQRPMIVRHPERFEAFLQAKRLGMPDKYAAQYASISIDAFMDSRDKGERDIAAGKTDTPYAQFAQSYKKAVGEFVAFHINEITKAAKHSWQASAWLLERLSPEAFGSKQEVKANVEGITIVNDVPKVPVGGKNGADIGK